LASACAPVQEISRSWKNKEALPIGPFKSVFVIAIVKDKTSRKKIETKFAHLISSRGIKAVQSEEFAAEKGIEFKSLSKEQMAELIKSAGCDAVFTVALKEVKEQKVYEKIDKNTEPLDQFYSPLVEYYPIGFGIYVNYYSYYNYYDDPLVFSEEGYVTEKIYYIENNFYGLEPEQLLWSIQSKAYNPTGLDSWLKGYSKLLVKQLKSDGLIKK
jgi:hypothetical protein